MIELHRVQLEIEMLPAPEIEAFKTLLLAIYSRPIVIPSTDHLLKTIELADYYRALPIFSLAVKSALLSSPKFVAQIPELCTTLLAPAGKLRNQVLFTECLIHATGPWAAPRYLKLEDPELRRIGEKAYNNIVKAIGDFQRDLLKFNKGEWSLIQKRKALEQDSSTMIKIAYDCPTDSGPARTDKSKLRLSQYYRAVYEDIGHGILSDFKHLLLPLLKSNLKLDTSGEISGQKDGKYAQCFLCAEIDDEDLPWDINQEDW